MNLIQLRTEVLAHGFDPITFSSRITSYLNDAQNQIARRTDYYIDEATQTVTTVAGTTNYAFPADFAKVRSVDDLDNQRELSYVNLRDIDRSSKSTGTPLYYAIDASGIHLYPTPDSATHNLQLRYWKMPAQLVNDTDTPSLPNDYHSMMWKYAVGECYYAEDDAQMGQAWMQRFAQDLAMFQADQRFPSSDGPTQVRGMWDPEPSLGSSSSWTLWGG